jgi:hypothetical protein
MAEQKNALTEVSFHGAKLIALRGDTPESTMVAMKPIVEGMGLAWEVQLRKIKAHPVLSKGMALMVIPSAGGPQETVALPLTRLNFWLALVQTNRVPDAETRERIITYQAEAADALFHHFFGQATANLSGPLAAKEHGGITKAVVNRALADHLTPVHAGMDELRAENRAITEKIGQLIQVLGGQVTDPAAAPAREFVPALTVLEARNWPQAGRRGMVVAVSARLERFSQREGYPIRISAEKGTRLFHVDAVSAWEAAEGRAFLAACRDRAAGQGRLNIERGRRGGAR